MFPTCKWSKVVNVHELHFPECKPPWLLRAKANEVLRDLEGGDEAEAIALRRQLQSDAWTKYGLAGPLSIQLWTLLFPLSVRDIWYELLVLRPAVTCKTSASSNSTLYPVSSAFIG